jgi:hypothetical protein
VYNTDSPCLSPEKELYETKKETIRHAIIKYTNLTSNEINGWLHNYNTKMILRLVKDDLG